MVNGRNSCLTQPRCVSGGTLWRCCSRTSRSLACLCVHALIPCTRIYRLRDVNRAMCAYVIAVNGQGTPSLYPNAERVDKVWRPRYHVLKLHIRQPVIPVQVRLCVTSPDVMGIQHNIAPSMILSATSCISCGLSSSSPHRHLMVSIRSSLDRYPSPSKSDVV